jgi:hypothetical protein
MTYRHSLDRKIVAGISAYERNTGTRHPLFEGIYHSRKRATDSEPLTSADAFLWYGQIKIGTPDQNFIGMDGLFCLAIKAAV